MKQSLTHNSPFVRITPFSLKEKTVFIPYFFFNSIIDKNSYYFFTNITGK